ncbi:hypothetical protein ACH47Z_42975 [Streptomyces sp. NPDC020192]
MAILDVAVAAEVLRTATEKDLGIRLAVWKPAPQCCLRPVRRRSGRTG